MSVKMTDTIEMILVELFINVMIWSVQKSDSKEVHLIHEIFMAQKLIQTERRR